MFHDLSDSMLDNDLRDVPIPAGLVARLKQTAVATDAVAKSAVPEVVVAEDADLDEVLRSPPLPHESVKRLLLAIQNEALDESLRQTQVPDHLLSRLRTISRPQRRSAWRRFAVAASLLLVIYSGYCGTLGALLAAIRPQQAPQASLEIIDLEPTEFHDESGLATLLMESDAIDSGFTPPTAVEAEPLRIELARLDASPGLGPAGYLFQEVQRGAPLTKDVFLMRWDTLGSPQGSDQALPELSHVRRRVVAGVDLPMAAGYDRGYFLKSGVHPPVFPATSQALRTIAVPLVTRTDSVELAQRLLREGRKPAATDIRVEDYLAAIEYGLPPAEDQSLALHATAGRSTFGRQSHHMLHLGVKAPQLTAATATHLSIVVDVSASMRGTDRIGAVRRALKTVYRHLGHNASISIVAVNHEIVQQVDYLPAGELARLTPLVRKLAPAGGDNLALGFQTAMSLAFEAEAAAGSSRHVVLITDGYAKIGDRDAARIRDLIATGEAHSISSTFLQLDSLHSSDSPPAGEAMSTISPGELPWRLVAIATGKSPVVARQAQLRLTFNPDAVLAYRLVGHGPTAVTGLTGVEVEADLHSGEEASAMFELWLRPDATGDVGWAAAHWTEPGSGASQMSKRLRIGRTEFAGSPDETPWRLHAASIAAEIGQRLGGIGAFELRNGGRFSQQSSPDDFKDVLEQAARADWRVAEQAGFQQVVDLARRMEELRPRRTNGLPVTRVQLGSARVRLP